MKKPHQQWLCSLLTGALAFGLHSGAFAEEADTATFALDEYVVSASRIPTKKAETAASVTVINRETIEQGHYRSVTEALTANQVLVDADSTGAVPVLNGDSRVLVLIDGRRMNWDQIVKSGTRSGVNLNSLPMQNVERIEIVRGPGSSLYGSDAVGGVINIITRKGQTPSTRLHTEIGSWGLRQYGLSTEGSENGLSYYITADHQQQDNFTYVDGKTGASKTFDRSFYDQDSWSLRLDKELGNKRSLSLNVEQVKRDFGFTYTQPEHSIFYYPKGHGKSEDLNTALTYRWNDSDFLRVYHNSSDNDTTYYGTASDLTYHNQALGAEWQKAWQLNAAHTVMSGIDWRENKIDYGSQGINASYQNKALFLEDRWQLPSQWTLTAGTRFEDSSLIGRHTTSRLSANRQINAASNLYASWGQSLKSPLMEDLFTNTAYMIGNPNLRPETGSTLTLGYNTELANQTLLQTSVFKSDITDAIDYGRAADGRTTVFNIAKQKRQGFTLDLSRKLSPQWTVSGGYSYLQIEDKADAAAGYATNLDNSQPNAYRLGFKYAQDKWNGALQLSSASGRSEARFTKSSYVTLDLQLAYQLEKTSRIYLKANNLTNVGYELRSSGAYSQPGAYAMPARNFLLGYEQQI